MEGRGEAAGSEGAVGSAVSILIERVRWRASGKRQAA